MKKGFFSSSSFKTKKKIPTTPRCGLCGLYKNCISPKMAPTGEGKRNILFVAEAPGEEEDRRNTQLMGRAGQLLKRHLRRMGVDLYKDCIKTNAVICKRKENQTPDKDTIKACRPNIIKTIERYQPNVIVLLGEVAIKSLIPILWKENLGENISRFAGYYIPCQKLNAWIIPTFHPSYVLKKQDKVLDQIFKNHLRVAVSKSKSKPWKKVPSYKDQIEIIMNPAQAAKEIKEMIRRGGPAAFDYEANCLKPEGDGVEITSCSICWRGKKTIAYPWQGEAIEATNLFTKSPLPKIASNLKFEDRWTRAHLGHAVRNWWWDTMIAAHVINNAPGVTSVKFQSFVLVGAESYDEHITPFLKSKGKSRFNRIQEIDMEDLLLYNGLDSLLEYKVAMKQMKLLEERS